jgi:hypothetical protein
MNKELIGVYCIDIKFLNSSSVRLNFFLLEELFDPGQAIPWCSDDEGSLV